MAVPSTAPKTLEQAHHGNPIPAAIRRQAEQADKLQRELLGQPQEAPPVTPETPPAAETAPPATPLPETQEAAPAPPPTHSEPSPEDRVRTAEGRLAVEREKRQGLENEVANLRRMVGELQQQQRPQPVQLPPQPQPKSRLVTPEEEADYGKDLLEVMGKRARDEVAGEMDELRGEIRKLNQQLASVGSRVTQRDTEDVFTELHRQVPGWVEQNSDENFINWLQQPEPFSGIKRHDLLTRAFDSHDAERVIRFFRGFQHEAAVTGQSPGPTPPPPPTGANGKIPLETFAAPGRAAPAQATAPQGEKPSYTRAQIAQFYTDRAAGKWRGREADAAAIEADFFRAGPEGRVIG